MTTRAAIYCRVSTTEQGSGDHVSLAVQHQRCKAYVEQHGWALVASEEDRESGLRPQRPGYNRVLALARQGAIDVVVVMAASRWGRDAAEVLARSKELTGLGVRLASTHEDLSTFLMLGIQAILNEEESRRISQRVAPALRYRAQQGYWPGHPPFGTVNEKGVLKPGPRFDLVELAYRLCLEGVPTREIARRLNRLYAPATINATTVRKMITNPLYAGIVRWKGEETPAQWAPLIPPETFAAAGEALRLRYRTRAKVTTASPYWIIGLAYCHCGARMTSKVERKSWGTVYPYLICNAETDNRREYHSGHVSLTAVQDWVVDQLRGLPLMDVDAILEGYERELRADYDVGLERRRTLEAERGRLEERIARAEQGYLDGLWGAERVLQLKAGVEDGIAHLDRELARLWAPEPDSDAELLRLFFESDAWLEKRDEAPAEFRELLRHLVDKVVIRSKTDYELQLRLNVEIS